MSDHGRLGCDRADPVINGRATPVGAGITLIPGREIDAVGDGSGDVVVGAHPDRAATTPRMSAAVEVRPNLEQHTISSYARRPKPPGNGS